MITGNSPEHGCGINLVYDKDSQSTDIVWKQDVRVELYGAPMLVIPLGYLPGVIEAGTNLLKALREA